MFVRFWLSIRARLGGPMINTGVPRMLRVCYRSFVLGLYLCLGSC